MTPGTRERRPGGGGASSSQMAPSLLPTADDPRDALAEHLNGAFVVVVEVTGGKYRRRCFLTVKAAERAARNATGAGHNARVYLAELRPLWRLVAPTSSTILDVV